MANPRAPMLLAVGLVSGLLAALVSQRGKSPDAPLDANSGTLRGLCEASAVLLHDGAILVGDNETESTLHRFTPSFSPLAPLSLTAEVEGIEALTLGTAGELWVVGSQGANKNGERKPMRARVLVAGGQAVAPDLSGCTVCVAARGLPPKEGGLSIEGAAYGQGALWLGVRSSLIGGDALLLRMIGDPAQSFAVAEVVPLRLDGLGVRDLLVVDDTLWVLAGPADGKSREHALYSLSAPGEVPRRVSELPEGSEGIAIEPSGSLLVVTDGDGKPGKPCKAPATWLRVPMPTLPAP